jgi:hypothetical protein
LSQKEGQESSSCGDDETNRSNHGCECQVDSRENLWRSLLYESHKHFALKCWRSAMHQSCMSAWEQQSCTSAWEQPTVGVTMLKIDVSIEIRVYGNICNQNECFYREPNKLSC